MIARQAQLQTIIWWRLNLCFVLLINKQPDDYWVTQQPNDWQTDTKLVRSLLVCNL